VLDRVKAEDVGPPFMVGRIVVDEQDNPRFEPDAQGPLKLWMNADAQGQLPKDRAYVVGVDASAGTGASNSCYVIGDKKIQEKVGEYANPRVPPHELADEVLLVAKWLDGAYLIWEAQGSGTIFGECIIRKGYRHVYYRRQEKSLAKKQSDIPGWFPTKETKISLHGDLRRGYAERNFKDPSAECNQEAREYIVQPNGAIEHIKASSNVDPTGARENHGDRVVATALCWKALQHGGKDKKQTPREIPVGSLAWRRQNRRRLAMAAEAW
jgi:hypothetical protein